MAIDSKEKRQGVIGVGRPYLRNKFPVATPDEQWRATSGLTYGGNALSPPGGPGAIMNQIQYTNLGADLFNGTLQ
jgi:hypothetical protein